MRRLKTRKAMTIVDSFLKSQLKTVMGMLLSCSDQLNKIFDYVTVRIARII